MGRRELRALPLVQPGRAGERQDDPRQVLRVRRAPAVRPVHADVRRNAGYCFVDFASPAAAAKALSLNGQQVPNSTRPFKLNWASGGGLAEKR